MPLEKFALKRLGVGCNQDDGIINDLRDFKDEILRVRIREKKYIDWCTMIETKAQ